MKMILLNLLLVLGQYFSLNQSKVFFVFAYVNVKLTFFQNNLLHSFSKKLFDDKLLIKCTVFNQLIGFVLRCNSDVGRIGGKQIVSLGDGCMFKSVIIHEIGHVIGFWHEQNRPDRDDYVAIKTENIKDGSKLYIASKKKFINNILIISLGKI